MKYFRLPFIILNILTVILLWAAGIFSTLDPNTYGWISLSGYVLPFLAIANVLFLALWIFVKKRFILISFIGLVAAYQPITTYCPLNTSTAGEDMPDSLITLLSYNTSNWGDFITSPDKVSTPEEKIKMLTSLFKEQNADIAILQESPLSDAAKPITSMYQHVDSIKSKSKHSVSISILSRYPIIKKEDLNIETKGNVCGAFWLNIDGREVIVINAHLEMMHFSMNDRRQFSTMVHGDQKDSDSIRSTSHTLVGKIFNATKTRAKQAEHVAQFISMHKDTPIILAGDFNDIPNSYVHKTLLEAAGNDCYTSTAFGPGYTFKNFGIRVRIDNIMCSSHFTPYNCHIIKDIKTSDHQPITCKVNL